MSFVIIPVSGRSTERPPTVRASVYPSSLKENFAGFLLGVSSSEVQDFTPSNLGPPHELFTIENSTMEFTHDPGVTFFLSTYTPSSLPNTTDSSGWLIDSDILTTNAWLVVKVALYLMLSMAILVANVIVILSISSKPRRTVAADNIYRHISSFCSLDLLAGLQTVYLLALTVHPVLWTEKYACFTYHGAVVFLLLANQTAALLALLDAYMALRYPIRYQHLVPPGRIKLAIAAVWLYSFCLAAVPLIWLNQWSGSVDPEACILELVARSSYILFVFAHFILVLVLAVVLYISIAYHICSRRPLMAICQSTRRGKIRYENGHQMAAQHAVTMILCSLSVFLLWGPYVGVWGKHVLSARRTALTTFMEEVFLILSLFQYCLRPPVYFVSLKSLRYWYRKLSCCANSGNNSDIVGPESRAGGISLNSVSFRSKVTGSLLNLHTALDGKAIRLPHIIVTDYDQRNRCIYNSTDVSDAPKPWYSVRSSGTSGFYSWESDTNDHDDGGVTEHNDNDMASVVSGATAQGDYLGIPPPDYP